MGIHFWVCDKASKIWQSSGRGVGGVGGNLTKLERPFRVSYSGSSLCHPCFVFWLQSLQCFFLMRKKKKKKERKK